MVVPAFWVLLAAFSVLCPVIAASQASRVDLVRRSFPWDAAIGDSIAVLVAFVFAEFSNADAALRWWGLYAITAFTVVVTLMYWRVKYRRLVEAARQKDENEKPNPRAVIEHLTVHMRNGTAFDKDARIVVTVAVSNSGAPTYVHSWKLLLLDQSGNSHEAGTQPIPARMAIRERRANYWGAPLDQGQAIIDWRREQLIEIVSGDSALERNGRKVGFMYLALPGFECSLNELKTAWLQFQDSSNTTYLSPINPNHIHSGFIGQTGEN